MIELTHKVGSRVVFIFFFGSGFAALIYQIVWLKYLNLLFGSTTYATAAVLCSFMFGLSLGSWLPTRMKWLFINPLRVYGIAEICIGIIALLFPWLYSALKVPIAFVFQYTGPATFAYNIFTFVLSFAVLVLPTSLMGATLPLLSDYLMRNRFDERTTGLLYGINTFGAVAGILCTAFLFIPALGLVATIHAGALINVVIGGLCYLYGTKESTPRIDHGTADSPSDRLLWLYTISGLLAISYEVFWTRLLVLHLGSSVYSYAIMLSVFLLGLSLGSYLSGRWSATYKKEPRIVFAWLQMAWAFSILLQIYQFRIFSDWLFTVATALAPLNATRHFLTLLISAVFILFLPTVLSGALFPQVVAHLWNRGTAVRNAVGFAYSFNTLGGIAGSVVSGFVLLPLFGTQMSLMVLAATNLLLALLAFGAGGSRATHARRRMVLAIVIFVTGAALLQTRVNVLQSAGIFQMEGEDKLLSLEEDVSATVSVEQRSYFGEPFHSLSINGINVAGTSPDLVTIQKLQAHIPAMLYGPLRPKTVLHIGFGSGGTARSVSLYPETRIKVVELTEAVVRNADKYFRSVNQGVVHAKNVEFVYFDGRSFLQNTTERFDVILSDSIHPRFSGNGSLYTKDYYQLVQARLNPRGVHSQWIPLYSLSLKNLKEILNAFVQVFPNSFVWYINSTINPYIVVTGWKGDGSFSTANVTQALNLPAVRADLASIGVTDIYLLLDYFLLGPKKLREFTDGVEPHIDDRMTVEYESSRILNRERSWLINFAALVKVRERIYPYLADKDSLDKKMYEKFFAATAFNLSGQMYFISGDREQARHYFQRASESNPSDREPYEFHNRRL